MHEASLTFRWKRPALKESVFAIQAAAQRGHVTSTEVMAALPQFPRVRLTLALDALIASNLASVNNQVLWVSPDVKLLCELSENPCPVQVQRLPDLNDRSKKEELARQFLIGQRAMNPEGMLALLKVDAKEVKR